MQKQKWPNFLLISQIANALIIFMFRISLIDIYEQINWLRCNSRSQISEQLENVN